MKPKITTLSEKKLIGCKQNMNYATYNPVPLWQSFMPMKKEITKTVSTDLFSVQQFPEGFWTQFNPETVFEKWAAVEVTDFDSIPANMNSLVIPEVGMQFLIIKVTGVMPQPFLNLFLEAGFLIRLT